jgi:hypothetical protein
LFRWERTLGLYAVFGFVCRRRHALLGQPRLWAESDFSGSPRFSHMLQTFCFQFIERGRGCVSGVQELVQARHPHFVGLRHYLLWDSLSKVMSASF